MTFIAEDKTANTISGGNIIWTGLVKVGDTGRGQVVTGSRIKDGLAITIPEDQIVTLSCKTISDTGSVTCIFRIKEEW